MADELTDEAKAEIAAAVAIVREDRLEKFLRGHPLLNPPKPTDPPAPKLTDPPAPKLTDPPGPKPTDPPPPKPTDPPSDPPKVKKGLWWPDDPTG